MSLTGLRAIAGAAIVLATSAANADTLHATYRITLIGLPIGTANLSAEVTPSHYSVNARASLSGLASMVSNSKGATTGSGAIVDGRISPTAYATTASNATMTRTIRMSISGNAETAVDIAPPFDEKPDRVPLTDKDKRGVVDPVGAFVVVAPPGAPLIGPAACDRTIPVLDGYTRFDLALSYAGQRDVTAKGYRGPAVVCSARYTPIAGHRPNRPSTKFMAENKNLEVWLAPIEGAHALMPFRLSVLTMTGTVVIEASEFSVTK